MGVGKTQIQGKPGEVTLNSAKTGLITATTPEELLEKATGWQAPIMHLAYWVQAKPATSNAQATNDEQNRLKQLIEDGWTVDFSYNDAQTLPNKLLLKQSLAEGKENRITMVWGFTGSSRTLRLKVEIQRAMEVAVLGTNFLMNFQEIY